MSNYITTTAQLTMVADAIRAKAGTDKKLAFPQGFADAVASISTGNGPVTELSGKQLSFSQEGQIYLSFSPDAIQLYENAPYTVKWDGTRYNCTAFAAVVDGEDAIALGNGGFLGGEDNGMPFLIGSLIGGLGAMTILPGETHTVDISFNFSAVSASDRVRPGVTVTVSRGGTPLFGAIVTAKKDNIILSANTNENGVCQLHFSESGTYTLSATYEGYTSTSGTVTVPEMSYSCSLSFFSATITVNTDEGAQVTIEKDGVKQTAQPTGGKAVFTVYETGTYTATATLNGNTKSETVSVTSSKNHDVALFTMRLNLEETSWSAIKAISLNGDAENYFAVGDTKSITFANATMGDLTLNGSYYVYILGFNHNADVEGIGIHFGSFKTSAGKDIALVNTRGYNSNPDYNTNFSHSNNGASTDVTGGMMNRVLGHGPATYSNSGDYYTVSYPNVSLDSPVADSFLSILPQELRNVLKLADKKHKHYDGTKIYTQKGYAFLLSENEVFGTNSHGKSEAGLTQQYQYFADGNSKIKYTHNTQSNAANWWLRTPCSGTSAVYVNTSGAAVIKDGTYCYGLAPIFIV